MEAAKSGPDLWLRPFGSTGYLQLLDEVEQNIMICQWRSDQLLAKANNRSARQTSGSVAKRRLFAQAN